MHRRHNQESMKKIILESPLPEFEKLLPLAQELMMQDDKEFLQYYQRLRRLHLLNGKNPEEIAVLVKNQWDLDGYDLRTVCVRCKGKGSEPCSYCKNTGVCQICKGAGTRIKYETNADFSSTKHQVECPKECAYCDGQKKTCSRFRINITKS